MLQRILSSPNLPSLPTIAVELLDIIRDPDVELTEIGKLVEKDPALCGKILRTVNSSYFGLIKPCPSIRRALTYLGLNTVKSLVLGFSLVELTKNTEGGFDLTDFWRRCLYSAAAARRIAMMTSMCDADAAFLAAVMQDVGMLAIHAAMGEQYTDLLEEMSGDHLQLPAHEYELLGVTHAEVGAELGEKWRLPTELINPIREHHCDMTVRSNDDAMLSTVVLSVQVSNLLVTADRTEAFKTVDILARRLFSMSAKQERVLLESTCKDAHEFSGFLEVKMGNQPEIGAILALAEDARVEHALKVHRETEQLRESKEQLSHEAKTDGLTGIANRKHFDETIAARFGEATRNNGCLGLILADVDRFKSVNDTLGHQAGDQVLHEIAKLLEQETGDEGLVCRYGGEEFGVIVFGASRVETAKLAERLRLRVADEPVKLKTSGIDLGECAITASFGVAALEPAVATILKKPQMLIQLADKSLYAAKEAGRNCVWVFNPKQRV